LSRICALAVILTLSICVPALARGQILDGLYLTHNAGTFLEFMEHDKDLKRDGVVMHYDDDGDVTHLMAYRNGHLHGDCVGYYDNGRIAYRASFRYGLRHGVTRYYFKDGTLRAVLTYRHGRPDGAMKFYSPNGIVTRVAFFDRGYLSRIE